MSGTDFGSTPATSPARRPSSCTSGSNPTCCPATPGRSRCPAAGSTSDSACCATASRTGPGHEAALARPAGTARTSSRPSAPDFELEDRHTAWPIPARRRRGHAVRRAGVVHRRRSDGHRRDDRRRHRPGAADRSARRRSDRRRRGAAARRRCSHLRRPRSSTTCSPTIACRRRSVGAGHVVGRAWSDPRRRGSGAWGRRNFARWMFEDEPRAVVLTPSRWHRRFLDRPGAYASAERLASAIHAGSRDGSVARRRRSPER